MFFLLRVFSVEISFTVNIKKKLLKLMKPMFSCFFTLISISGQYKYQGWEYQGMDVDEEEEDLEADAAAAQDEEEEQEAEGEVCRVHAATKELLSR